MSKRKKPQRERKTKKPSEKINQLNWHTFNFLENMLIFCAVPDRNAPQESGVHFRISPRENNESLCLLFKIDRGKDSLFENDEIKPDYMVLYAKPNLCLCTIIEMKGRKDIKHGIKQVKALHERLKKEVRKNLPNKLEVKFQAIILSPPNPEIPKTIVEENTKEFTIRPVQYPQKAELFDYVSQEITLTAPKLKPEPIRRSRNASLIETVLTQLTLPKRIDDKFCNANEDKATNKEGIYINYALSEDDNYAALAIDNTGMKIGVKESKNVFQKQIQNDLEDFRINNAASF